MALHTASSGQFHSCVSEAIVRTMSGFAVFAADPDEIANVWTFAAGLIGPDIARVETLRRVHEAAGVGLFVVREGVDIVGVIAFVPLSAQGLAAVRADEFNAVDPAPNHVAVWGSDPCALYGWGIAAAHPKTARQLLGAYDAMVRTTIPNLPVFARAATVLGERMLTRRLNFKPYRGSATGLLWIEPYNDREFVAA